MTKPEDSKQAIPSPEDRVREIREREQKATEGPWKVLSASFGEDQGDCDPAAIIFEVLMPEPVISVPDADFISHARADIPYLLSLVEELKGQVATKEPTPEQIKAIKVGIIKKWQSWIGPLGNPDHYKIQAKMLELEVARETAETEVALLRKRKDYHTEYVEAVEAAEKAKGELGVMREALQEIASYEDEIFAKQIALKALTPEPATKAEVQK